MANKLVRLKPVNEKTERKGYKVRIYSIFGLRFLEERGWYEVSEDIAAQLAELHQEHYDLDSPDLFDVCTPEEAAAIDEKEAEAEAIARSTARKPSQPIRTRTASSGSGGGTGDMSTADIAPDRAALNPPDEDDDDDGGGRIAGLGRVDSGDGPRTRTKKR